VSRKKVTETGTFVGFSSRLREIRAKLSQEKFGKILGVTKVTISRYEAGRVPDVETLNRIANYGGVTVEWLLHGDAPEPAAVKIQEFAPIYDASPLPPLAETALTEVIAAVEDYYARHRLKRRPIQKARLIIRLYQHYAETREKPDDILIKGNLPLAD
jgi:transcriptional regulator with XRE-family HTH domain